MKYIVSLLPFFVTLCVAGLNLFLSGKQKERFNDQTLRLWDWLTKLQQHSLLDWLRHHSRLLATTATVLAACYAAWITLSRPGPVLLPFGYALFVLILVGAGAWCGLKFIFWTLNARTLFIVILRASLVLVLSYGTLLSFGLFASAFKQLLTPQGGVVTVFQMAFVLGWIPSVLFIGLILLFWAVVTFPVLIVCAIAVLLWASEFVLRRTAEHPTGFIALGTFSSAAIVFIIKAFGG